MKASVRSGSPFLAALVGLVVSTSATAQPAQPFTYTDMLMLDRIGGLSVDPAGRAAVFNVRATDMENNRGVSSLWMKDLERPAAPEVKLALSEGGASDVQWAHDGSGFFFLSARGESGTRQVWKADAKGEQAMQVTDLMLEVETYRVAPDGSGLVVALSIFPDCTGNGIPCTVERLKERKADQSTGRVYDKLFMRHWDTWADGTRNHLYYLPLPDASASPVALMPGFDGDVP